METAAEYARDNAREEMPPMSLIALKQVRGTLLVAVAALLTTPGNAQSPDALKGKTVTIYVGYGSGGGYDMYARVMARYIGRYLPGNPTVVVSNMPGAESLIAANYIYDVAPKDGTAVGIVAQEVAEEQALGTAGVRYDVTKFNWIGRIASNVEITYVWHTVPVKTIEDVKYHETILAGTGPTSEIYPRLLNEIAGTKFKVILGYNTTADGHLAMQRGEVEGATSSYNTLRTAYPEWLDKKLVNILVQFALQRSPNMPDVPAVVELGKTEQDKQLLTFYANSDVVGRSVMAPSGMPDDRVQMLRSAFDSTMKDPDFIADIQSSKMEYDPMPGAPLQKLFERAVDVSPAVLERARAAQGQ
jgi:tripartite-type tricarboxylate transporter receptor subunit TctC